MKAVSASATATVCGHLWLLFAVAFLIFKKKKKLYQNINVARM